MCNPQPPSAWMHSRRCGSGSFRVQHGIHADHTRHSLRPGHTAHRGQLQSSIDICITHSNESGEDEDALVLLLRRLCMKNLSATWFGCWPPLSMAPIRKVERG